MAQTLGEWLRSEPYTLTMSSGFFSFFAHCGVVSVLEENDLKPAAITGSSAGALVGSCWASGCPATELRDFLFRLEKKDFWDPGLGLGYLRGKLFEGMVANMARVEYLEQCPIPVAVSVFDGFALKTKVMRSGPLSKAVVASCSVPLMFHPVRLNGRLLWDGGVADRPGIQGAGSGRVFYHHILSRSPWRRKGSKALQIPLRDNLQALAIPRLPRSGPDALHVGREAFQQARESMQLALGQPVMIRASEKSPIQPIPIDGRSGIDPEDC